MTNWAATTDQIIDNGFGDDREGREIQGIIIHHVAGTDGLDYVANANSRDSHPTYHVDRRGKTSGIVHPNRQPFSMGHDVDNIVITVEVDNTRTGDPWPVSDESIEAIIQICLDHEKQSSRNGFAKNIRGTNQKEFFIGWHSQYKSTACPGPHILSKIDYMVAEMNKRKAGNTPSPAPTPVPAPAPEAPRPTSKSIADLAQEVLDGKHGNGDARVKSLGANYAAVQAEVNRRLSGKPAAPKPVGKTISQLAQEVIDGKHGNGDDRVKSLGSNYAAVQARVNVLLGQRRPAAAAVNISRLADRVMRGEFGNGPERRRRLGVNYAAVQAEVNRRLAR